MSSEPANYEKLFAAIYSENDLGRSIATAFAGGAGLGVYLLTLDWVIAAFSAVIVFPLVRVIATAIHSIWKERQFAGASAKQAAEIFHKLSPEERKVLAVFLGQGGSRISWSAANRTELTTLRPALNSLIGRGVLTTTVMEDGMTEAFALDVELFDIAQRELRK